MQLTLALIEKGQFYIADATNKGVGEAIVEIYNEIAQNINTRGNNE